MSIAIQAQPLPQGALLAAYQTQGCYTDCYVMEAPGQISLPQYIQGFYSSAAFRAEKYLLGWLLNTPWDDLQLRRLAQGEAQAYSAWTVEARSPQQLLLCDVWQRTRSWLMVAAQPHSTRLYFGSAVVPQSRTATGQPRYGWAFHALGGFHRAYSQRLMLSALAQLP